MPLKAIDNHSQLDYPLHEIWSCRMFRSSLPVIALMSSAALPAQVSNVPVPSDSASAEAAEDAIEQAIVITGARTQLPATALPMTVDVLGGQAGRHWRCGSVIDSIRHGSGLSPTREKLSGSGEPARPFATLRHQRSPQSTPIATVRATASPSIPLTTGSK